MIETTTKSHVFFFWHCIDEQEPMRFFHCFLVHALKLLEIDRGTERVVDLLELCLVSRLVHSELRGVQPNQTWNTHPGLC